MVPRFYPDVQDIAGDSSYLSSTRTGADAPTACALAVSNQPDLD